MTDVIEVQSLWDSATAVPKVRQSPEEAFDAFCRRNSWFMPRLAQMAYDARSRGARRVSMKLLFEELRGDIDDQGHTWRLNNSWTKLATLRLIELYPDLDGLFELRGRK